MSLTCSCLTSAALLLSPCRRSWKVTWLIVSLWICCRKQISASLFLFLRTLIHSFTSWRCFDADKYSSSYFDIYIYVPEWRTFMRQEAKHIRLLLRINNVTIMASCCFTSKQNHRHQPRLMHQFASCCQGNEFSRRKHLIVWIGWHIFHICLQDSWLHKVQTNRSWTVKLPSHSENPYKKHIVYLPLLFTCSEIFGLRGGIW